MFIKFDRQSKYCFDANFNDLLNRLSNHSQPIVYQTKLSKLNVGGVVDILYQVDELRPSLDQIIPKLKENGISGKVLRHCDLKELKNVSARINCG